MNPRPYQIAYAAYHEEPPGLTWEKMMAAHLNQLAAYLICTPDLFIAARIVKSEWDDATLLDPRRSDFTGDTFHIYVAAGRLADMVPLIPIAIRPRLAWFTFQRRGYEVHRVPASRFLR